MQNKHELDSLTQVLAAHHQVSVQFDHDPRRNSMRPFHTKRLLVVVTYL
jgi:hypothetical protein